MGDMSKMSRKRSKKSLQNRLQNGLQNPLQNQVNREDALLPVKAALSANKGSDLLLLGSNNLDAAGGHPQRQLDSVPQLLREGQIIRLRPHRRHL